MMKRILIATLVASSFVAVEAAQAPAAGGKRRASMPAAPSPFDSVPDLDLGLSAGGDEGGEEAAAMRSSPAKVSRTERGRLRRASVIDVVLHSPLEIELDLLEEKLAGTEAISDETPSINELLTRAIDANQLAKSDSKYAEYQERAAALLEALCKCAPIAGIAAMMAAAGHCTPDTIERFK